MLARCQFIIGDPRRQHSVCAAPVEQGKLLCAQHWQLCHLPKGSQAEARELKRYSILARSRRAGRDVPHFIPALFTAF